MTFTNIELRAAVDRLAHGCHAAALALDDEAGSNSHLYSWTEGVQYAILALFTLAGYRFNSVQEAWAFIHSEAWET